ncbi:MAG TPA: COX15/CtaA family protein [Chitinophagaceae bacterium]|nr:COX15/CtaA family protein [Chitinophagaceae bacterium]
MSKNSLSNSSRPVAIWLLVGVGMIMVQVLLGGITRLTGSGLSITEWKPVLGALPPMNEQDWNTAFEKYQKIAQYKYINFDFSLSDFKFIYFWEWFHRLWARLIAVAFVIPFVIFLIQKRFKKEMIKPMIILFLLGALQGLVGWIMVQSGLEDSELVYVSHYKLAIHFILALVVLCYAMWFALELLVPAKQIISDSSLSRFIFWIFVILIVQLIYGAFMAGLKAAAAAPTWPLINGNFFPFPVYSIGNRQFSGLSFLTENSLVVHFIHRSLAYVIAILIFIWWRKAGRIQASKLFQRTKIIPLLLVFLQVLLGVVSVLSVANSSKFLWLAEAHQLVAMLLLLSLVWVMFLVRNNIKRTRV